MRESNDVVDGYVTMCGMEAVQPAQCANEHSKLRVQWYRSPVPREEMRQLNQRSDFKGFLQTGGYLGLLACTGSAAYFSAGRLPWPVVVLLFFFHGMCWQFLINGFHELVHDSVFKTRWLNRFFLRVFSFLGWYNHHQFWASHTEHHKYTLHPPDDLEVVLPQKHTVAGWLQMAVINPMYFWWAFNNQLRWARGRVAGVWETALFPESNPEKRRLLFNWSRIVLLGHGLIIAVSIVMHWWLLPVVITFAPFYGGWLHFLCNSSQHAGLQDNVTDYRLCCRTITLNPFVRFLYWHMNYHTEHHMYAAVPCYNLGRLHELIKADLPECPHGLFATWKQIAEILRRQKIDPTYQYSPALPSSPLRRAS
jgi:fatty acid desaturase